MRDVGLRKSVGRRGPVKQGHGYTERVIPNADTFPGSALDRLREGATGLGISLTDEQVAAFGRFGSLLLAANRRVNLTAIDHPDEVVERHFLDSLAVLAHPALRSLSRAHPNGLRVVDVGTGAGFPGLPLKIARPELDLRLIESTGKKAAFVQTVIDQLGLAGASVLTGRAEELAHQANLRETHQLALARAVAPLAVLLELTLPFVAVGGIALYHKTWPLGDQIVGARIAVERLGGVWQDLPEDTAVGTSPRRILITAAKVSPTPAAYPRRAGIPAKRPLGKV